MRWNVREITGEATTMKRIKGDVICAALWMVGLMSAVLASGAGTKFWP
jgi:hypothetical protein